MSFYIFFAKLHLYLRDIKHSPCFLASPTVIFRGRLNLTVIETRVEVQKNEKLRWEHAPAGRVFPIKLLDIIPICVLQYVYYFYGFPRYFEFSQTNSTSVSITYGNTGKNSVFVFLLKNNQQKTKVWEQYSLPKRNFSMLFMMAYAMAYNGENLSMFTIPLLKQKSKNKMVGVLPIRIVQSSVSSIGPSSERNRKQIKNRVNLYKRDNHVTENKPIM